MTHNTMLEKENRMSYKYQTHIHTHPCSACGKMSIEELVEALHKGGYQGCVITNHFLHGNCGIDRSLCWEDFVKEYEKDWLLGKACAEKYGMDIIFGLEEGVGGGREILLCGITPEMLYSHPELREPSVELWHKVLNSYGVLIIQAHPYRERSYISSPGLLPCEFIDGIEVCNRGNMPEDDEHARLAADEHKDWVLLSGSDSHTTDTACIMGIESYTRIRDGSGLVSLLKSGKYRLITERSKD